MLIRHYLVTREPVLSWTDYLDLTAEGVTKESSIEDLKIGGLLYVR